MKKSYLLIGTLFVFLGCAEEKPKKKLDGEALMSLKCASCHALEMPPKSFESEVAPPMMAVGFHLKDFIKANDASSHEAKFISFVQEYVIDPSAEKSICDKLSLESYGVMPSQKGKVTQEELGAIAKYMYKRYDNQILLAQMAEKSRLESMLPHERVLEQQKCTNCHEIEKDKIAPSFKMIANRYEAKESATLFKSIKEGSRGKWENKKLPMPPYKNMSDKDIQAMVDWILGLKEKRD